MKNYPQLKINSAEKKKKKKTKERETDGNRERAMDLLASTTQQCVEFNNSADMAVTLK